MDYKYIEQLMERYWNAETSMEEESILRSFFSQENIPAEMEQWRPLFVADAQEPKLSDDFDARILAMIGKEAKSALTSASASMRNLMATALSSVDRQRQRISHRYW